MTTDLDDGISAGLAVGAGSEGEVVQATGRGGELVSGVVEATSSVEHDGVEADGRGRADVLVARGVHVEACGHLGV